AARLVDSGRSVFGIMLRLWSAPGSTNRCCSPADVERARRVARQLGIPFYVLDMQKPFRDHVVSVFLDGYAQGRTPNPCITCNRQVRFTNMLQAARSMGATKMATGHYARLELGPTGPILSRGLDVAKDQSYVLSMLTRNELAQAAFPLGEMTKPEVREYARRLGLAVADRPESQDLCFLGGRDYRDVLREMDGARLVPGPILDVNGNILGEHRGLADYTIGQRKGIQIAGPKALYVVAKDPDRNALVVGPRSALGRTTFRTEGVNWISHEPPVLPLSVAVQIRYRAPARPAEVIPGDDRAVEVRLHEPAPDVTPGQYAVFYDGDRCLGGGMIVE
ncbi:MAG TPA: tRNA 2-thiouridine(34) synthase MnmA, partial [Anaerolineales bacterium]|nr:tRNA 2-thiouridine(34) synthase MnmA [Anaerolineales bacterium]